MASAPSGSRKSRCIMHLESYRSRKSPIDSFDQADLKELAESVRGKSRPPMDGAQARIGVRKGRAAGARLRSVLQQPTNALNADRASGRGSPGARTLGRRTPARGLLVG